MHVRCHRGSTLSRTRLRPWAPTLGWRGDGVACGDDGGVGCGDDDGVGCGDDGGVGCGDDGGEVCGSC